MSPEQARGKPLDPRSDLYSIGVVLYQLLAGRAPFDDDDAVVVMARHIRERPLPVRQVAPPDRPIPERLERVVAKALEKDPRRRLPHAEAFDNALAACLPEVEALADPDAVAATPAASASFARRARSVAVGAALAGAFAAIVVAGVLGAGRPAEGHSAVPWLGAMGSPPRSTPTPDEVVRTEIASRPSGARVIGGDGHVLGATPLVLERVRGTQVDLTLRLAGHGPATASLTLDGSRKVVALEPLPPRFTESDVAAEDAEGDAADEAADPAPHRRRDLLAEEPYVPFD